MTRHLLLSMLLFGCSPDSAEHRSTTVRFELGDGPLDLGQIPFPSDLYRDSAGAIRIGAVPNPGSDTPLFEAIRTLLEARAGFCTTCTVRFELGGALDPSSLDAGLLLVAVDGADPPVPVVGHWDPLARVVAVRPRAGHVLDPGRRYAAVLGRSVRDEAGTHIAPSPTLARLLAGHAIGAREVVAEAALHEVLEALAPHGIDADDIAGLAWFTTDTPAADLERIRSAVRAAPAPALVVDRVWVGAEVDELLGVPSEARPGTDVAPAAGVAGTAAIVHDTTGWVVTGTFAAPRFVEGSGTDVGRTTRDDSGHPEARTDDRVPFALIVPEDADLGDLGVVVHHHGFSASRATGFVLADTVGHAGYAVLALDGFQHGARAPSARDERYALRGNVGGEDGLAETFDLDVSARMFGVVDTAPGEEVSPAYPLAAFMQLAADAMSAVYLVQDGDLGELQAADPGLSELAFDPARVVYVGNSMGSVVGTAVLSAEPELAAAVLNVAPGAIVDTLVEAGEFAALTHGLLLPVLGVTPPAPGNEAALGLDPTVDLYRWAMEPVDPLALAPAVRARLLDGPDLLVQLAGHDEVAAPAPSQALVRALGLAGFGDFAHADIPPAVPGASQAAVRFDGAMHGMMELGMQESAWMELDPLVPREESELRANPIDAVHEQIEAFVRSLDEEGHGSIEP